MSARTKAFAGPVTIKDADKGLVEAVIATLNVVDSDGDVTLPGAFKEGAPVMISAWNHSAVRQGVPPVGRGTLHERGEQVVLEGSYFMSDPKARASFEAVKGLDEIGQWSYGFHVEKSDPGQFEGEDVQFLKALDAFEASPVYRGAGIGTATLSAKDAGEEHQTFAQEAQTALAAVEGLIERSKALAALRAKEGRTLSAANRDRLTTVAKQIDEASEALSELLAEPPTPSAAGPADTTSAEAQREELRMLHAAALPSTP